MLTKKKIIIPIFEYPIKVIVFDSWEEVSSIFSMPPSRGTVVDYSDYSIIAVCSKFPATLVHESYHLTNSVWRFIGYTPERDNDEVTAYLQTYIYNKLNEVFEKHWKNK